MNNVIYTDAFVSKLKRFVKKYPSILDEIEQIAIKLEQDSHIGTSLGAGLYKIRLAVESKGGGKSGGFRLISYVVYQMPLSNDVYLLTLYDKSEEESITKQDLIKIAKRINP
jgi:hypothetical protein